MSSHRPAACRHPCFAQAARRTEASPCCSTRNSSPSQGSAASALQFLTSAHCVWIGHGGACQGARHPLILRDRAPGLAGWGLFSWRPSRSHSRSHEIAAQAPWGDSLSRDCQGRIRSRDECCDRKSTAAQPVSSVCPASQAKWRNLYVTENSARNFYPRLLPSRLHRLQSIRKPPACLTPPAKSCEPGFLSEKVPRKSL